MRTLNLGILAHVDAGKTTLTERLLYAAGVIDELGSVDAGSTQTDTLALERQRGITIKTAVVSFAVGDLTVNLIDTPGHPDFIAEVERVLGVLDGAVLVVSAVEGVQPQTRVLMRALQRLRIPTLFFVNKTDRAGADPDRVIRAIRERLGAEPVAMADVTAAALQEALAAHDDELLAAFVDGATLPGARLREALAHQTARALVHPVYAGSALTGAGVDELTAGIVELLPAAEGDGDGPLSGSIFKIERGPAGEKIAYARLFSGTLAARDRLPYGKVTAIAVFDRGPAAPSAQLTAGRIGKLWGLHDARIGDTIGVPRRGVREHFARPTLETVVVPRRGADRGRLRVALAQLAEQDPLIDLRQDDLRRELSVSLYGEVQKEVVRDTLAADFGVEVEFRESTTICIERAVGTGESVERISDDDNPFLAGVGLRVDPAPLDSGVTFGIEIELGSLPPAFLHAIEETVHRTAAEGLHGWQLAGCRVTLIHSGYYPRQSHAHQGFDASMSSTAGDFRNLTPLVLMAALARAGTEVLEPVDRFHLELPADAYGPILPVLARLRATPRPPAVRGAWATVEGEIPGACVHELRQRLPSLTRGEGVLECAFDHYAAAAGRVPSRPRSDDNPVDREEYLLRVRRRRVTAPLRA